MLKRLKSEVDKLGIDKFKIASTDLSEPSNVVNNDVIKKTVYDKLATKESAIDISKLVKKTDYNTKIKETKDKIPNHDKFTTTFEFNKFPSIIFDEKLNKQIWQLKLVLLILKKDILWLKLKKN